ncbi:VOC family protein [Deinococcus peraridilitoris]|uniref:VOC domain-containing protein n=1 Tax=Deinococcus peraridilitoris (strain DSM 19664 / LMG 22246 / CIP 109416 / KR-200) TaxID=937777 RepID=K9ZXF7_DEIPD|nr:VOC family protein [Deinococcus peraridilitoris]AFZ65884.1 hypothetical protein Deipe_0283 [Deinococcus peraridilitoris DSM 19664]
MIVGLDHVQVCAPAGCEEAARTFFGTFLELPELRKPAPLRPHGGAWFGLPDGRQVHVGVEQAFAPARKAHPCLRCDDLEALTRRAEQFGVACEPDDRLEQRRVYLADPWGNRWEVVEGGHGSEVLLNDE